MLHNTHIWDLWLRVTTYQIPNEQKSILIPASSLKGNVRSFLERLNDWQDVSKSIFGEIDFPSFVYFSDLVLDETDSEPDIHIKTSVAIDPNSTITNSSKLYKRKVVSGGLFTGKIELKNGGVYPAVLISRLVQLVLGDAHIGPGSNRGLGKVDSCKLTRNFQAEESKVLSPINRIFRQANLALIEELTKNPGAIDKVEWRDLERLMAQIYEEIGFEVKLTDSSHDGGKDLILTCLSPNKIWGYKNKINLEIKHWKTPVGIGPVKKLIQVSETDAATGSVFVSTSGFATTLSNDDEIKKKVRLENLTDIHNLINQFQLSRSDEAAILNTLEEIISPKIPNQ